MSQVIIENPILNPPFAEPNRNSRFDDEGITEQIQDAWRISCYFTPIPKPREQRKDLQPAFNSWTEDRIEENVTIRGFNEDANPGLLRIASKMPTGSCKTVVMPKFIGWDAQSTIRALLATGPDTAKGDPHAYAT